jgi:hypothetical protein
MSYKRYDFSVPGENQTKRLSIHPLNTRIYGDTAPDAALLESVKANGIFNPIIVNRDKQILSGTRRWLAAISAGFDKVPVLVLLERNKLLHELFLIESNRTREKTAGQIARETAELFRIEKELAAEREKAGKTLGTESTKGGAREIAAEKTRQSPATVAKQVAIVTKAEAGDPVAKKALRMLDGGSSVISAYRTLNPVSSPGQTKWGGHVALVEKTLQKLPRVLQFTADIESRRLIVERIKNAFERFLKEVDVATVKKVPKGAGKA